VTGASCWYTERIATKDERISLLQERLDASGKSVPAVVAQQLPPESPLWLRVFVISFLAITVVAIVLVWRISLRLSRFRKDLSAKDDLLENIRLLHRNAVDERDQIRAELQNKKHEYAMEVFENYSKLPFKDPQPMVTVRFANYGSDHEIAQKIQGVFSQYVKWSVHLDGSNNPALAKSGKFKVVFDIGGTYFTYMKLIHAIREGDFLGVSIGKMENAERDDPHHLIAMVLPSEGAKPMQADPI
jgi:hypothetical protein